MCVANCAWICNKAVKFYRKERSFVDIKIIDKNPRATRLIREENYQWKLTNAVTKNAGISRVNKQ